jgi:hypothetical protein
VTDDSGDDEPHTGGPDLPTPFDEATLRAVAAATGVDAATLRRLVGAHQASLRRHASVAGWVYEVRRAYPLDALLARRPEAFYLAVEPTVWPEFESAIGATGDELAALRKLHGRVLRSVIDAPDDDREPMVVVRE